jgi:hypothetical protein
MNIISIDKIVVDYANSKVSISDIFIDGCSFQEILKSTFTNEFSIGRFKEFFMPILGLNFSDKLEFEDDAFSNLIPKENQTFISPVYGCNDDCCVYVFLKISNKNNTIFWEGIGRNSNYIFDKEVSKNSIDWLSDFTHYQFEMNNYKKIINQLN